MPPPPPPKRSFWSWLTSLFASPAPAEPARGPRRRDTASLDKQEARVLGEFEKTYGLTFKDPGLLKLALTHRSYLSVTGQGPRESNERLEFLGDSVLGLVTSEFLYRRHPDEHEGQLTKTKSLLVSKAILSRRALKMGLGRFVLMSHSEVESGGRQRLSILADAFESVLGAVYLDQGFEVSRKFIHDWLLVESDAITADKRHTNYKSHLQEYVQSTYRTHPVYRIRSEYGPDHSKHFMVEVMVGRRTLGEGRGHNKKEAEQAAARDALEKVERVRRGDEPLDAASSTTAEPDEASHDEASVSRRRRGRRGGRGRSGTSEAPQRALAPIAAGGRVPADEDEAVVEEYEADERDIDDAGVDEDDTSERVAVANEHPAPDEDDEFTDDEDDELDEDDDEPDDEDEDDDELDAAGAPGEEPGEQRHVMARSRFEEPPRSTPPQEPVRRAPAPPPAPPPVAFGRAQRRPSRGPVPQAEPAADVHEPREASLEPAPPPPPAPPAAREAPPAVREEDHDERVTEMEQAMADFGKRAEEPARPAPQQRGPGYGRRGRPGGRGRR